MKKHHIVKAALKVYGDDDARYWYVQSLMKDKGVSMADAVRELIDVHREYTKRGGFLDISDVEDAFIWRIEELLRGKVLSDQSTGESIPQYSNESDVDGNVLGFDPSEYGI